MDRETFSKIYGYYKSYRDAAQPLRSRLKQNDKWYRGAQDEFGRQTTAGMPESRTGHIFNAIQYKHADFMDNFPHVNILPREEADEQEAEKLTGIMPFILENCGFKKTYSKNCYEKIKSGPAVYGVFYNAELSDGMGDIDIVGIDLKRLCYQPEVEDIQDSKYVFYDTFMDIEAFHVLYGERSGIKTQQSYEEDMTTKSVPLLSESVVITDCYYKKRAKNGQTILHFLKFSGSEILDYTEGRAGYEHGLYAHGKYPFVFDVLHPVPGDIAGMGIIDIGKNAQAYIDKLDEIINKNALINGLPRYFIGGGAGVSEKEFLDVQNTLVHVVGSVTDDNVRPIQSKALPSFISQHRQDKILELKEIVGNRDFNQGGTSGGVTSGNAIMALQNSGDKLSRDMINTSYYAFSEIIWLVIELIRQFYTEERTFRILGEDAKTKYLVYQNSGMTERVDLGEWSGVITPEEAAVLDVPVHYKKPVFDISLTVEKNNPYQRGQHNELILSLANMGLFNPEKINYGIFIVSNLNFDGKDKLLAQMKELQEKQEREQTTAKRTAALAQAVASADSGHEMVAFPAEEQNPVAEEVIAFPADDENNRLELQ